MANANADHSEVIREYRVGQVLTPAQVQAAAVQILMAPNLSSKEKALNDAFRTGDYGNIDAVSFKGMPLKKRMFLGMKLFDDKMKAEFGDAWSGDTYAQAMNSVLAVPGNRERFTDLVDRYAMEPFFRIGLSTISHMGMHANDTREREGYAELAREDERVTRKVVEETIAPLTAEKKENILRSAPGGRENAEKLIAQNEEQQLTMAKFFLMMQMGGVRQRDRKEGEQHVGTASMAEFIAHGGRLMVTLPTGSEREQDRMFDATVGVNRGSASGMIRRTAATHDVKPKKVAADGTVIRAARETTPLTSLSNNYGMNFAGGGMGNQSTGTGKMILNDGTSGHCYLKMIPGNATECGQMLIGFETSEPGKANTFGLKHDWHARSAPQSSFLADKTTPGIKHGGREVDLSNLSPESYATVMNRFEQRYRQLQKQGNTEGLKDINDLLTGKPVNTKELSMFFQDQLGFTKEYADRLATESRFALASAGKNLADSDKVKLPEDETAADPAMNRMIAEERAEEFDAKVPRTTRALASQAKRDEMARQMKDLRTGKFGFNSGDYKKLLRSAEALQRDVGILAQGGLSQIERTQLIQKIEHETEETKKLAKEYVKLRGKGKAHPSFSSSWGEKRFYAARNILALTEKMQEDLETERDRLRPDRPAAVREDQRERNNGIGPIQQQVREDPAVKDTDVNSLAEKIGAPVGQQPKDFSKLRPATESSLQSSKIKVSAP